MTRHPSAVPADHVPVKTGHVGVLLVNLGTPDAPTPAAVKRYLAEFLSDPRVVEIPPLVWQPILRGVILTTRPKKSAHAYGQIWTNQGSPLAVITQEQAAALQHRLGEAAVVRFAMRYGNPSIAGEFAALMEHGCDRILIAPLYPQYAAATNASAMDAVSNALNEMRWQPSLRVMPPYYDAAAYIDALAADLGAQLDALDFAPEVLLLSFHGVPERSLHLGDPYHCQCQKTARLLAEALGRPGLRVEITFQSRFGRAKWLEPATDAVIDREAGGGPPRGSPSPRPALPPIASKRSRSWPFAGASNSSPPAASAMPR
jgi:ferrochelatase